MNVAGDIFDFIAVGFNEGVLHWQYCFHVVVVDDIITLAVDVVINDSSGDSLRVDEAHQHLGVRVLLRLLLLTTAQILIVRLIAR